MLNRLYREFVSGPLPNLKASLLASFIGLLVTVALLSASGHSLIGLTIAVVYVAALALLGIVLALRTSAKLNDLHYEVSLRANIQSRNQVVRDLYMDGAAANPSLMLLLWKCLHHANPRTVLELGSGHTTKLLSSYLETNPAAEVTTLEHDANWIALLKPEVTRNGRGPDIKHTPLEARAFACPVVGTQVHTEWFSVGRALEQKKFDLILVDGPNGTHHHSRSGVLEHFPAILSERFIVIFDDAERHGEVTTVDLCRSLFDGAGIAYVRFDVDGVKRQTVFCSPTFEYLRYT